MPIVPTGAAATGGVDGNSAATVNQGQGHLTKKARGAVVRHVDPYVPSVEPFQNYLDRLEVFFDVNDMSEGEKV